MIQKRARPVTHQVDVERALATLDHAEMLALAALFEQWALNEEMIDGEQRTRLIEWSSDYEAIAAFAGPTWIATDPEDPPGPLAFHRETRAHGTWLGIAAPSSSCQQGRERFRAAHWRQANVTGGRDVEPALAAKSRQPGRPAAPTQFAARATLRVGSAAHWRLAA